MSQTGLWVSSFRSPNTTGRSRRSMLRLAAFFLVVLVTSAGPADAQDLGMGRKTWIADGWHPWYEVKADPESPKNIIVCGTKWDGQHNAPFGFVYVSTDEGATWRNALEDRNSTWVTEQSCAFGSKHRAYFISEASKVIDGAPKHKLGTTRLYVSEDGGQHWIETIKTRWADWSTSAVSSSSARLYTFFNAIATSEPGMNRGSNIGLLVFSSDGKNVTGPFFDSTLPDLAYEGIFPSDATTLKSGRVVALYWGRRVTSLGMTVELGLVRADQSREPSLEHTVISQAVVGTNCLSFYQSSLAYDPQSNRLFLAYVDACDETRIMLTSSEDEGKTWAQSVAVGGPRNSNQAIVGPSLVVGSGGMLGLLWEEGESSGRWLFSRVLDKGIVEPPIELFSRSAKHEVSNDSLWTILDPENGPEAGDTKGPPEASITLNVRSDLNNVWREKGLVATKDKIVAVWPTGNWEGMRLYAGLLEPLGRVPKVTKSAGTNDSSEPDVTRQTVILYGGTQHFDTGTGTLQVCMVLGNRGDKPIRAPITLEVEDIKSPLGSISILGSTNGLAGPGARWDISYSVGADQINSGSNTNPFCISFHLEISPDNVAPLAKHELLILKMRILASPDVQIGCDQKTRLISQSKHE
jgi:hypothetical protein